MRAGTPSLLNIGMIHQTAYVGFPHPTFDLDEFIEWCEDNLIESIIEHRRSSYDIDIAQVRGDSPADEFFIEFPRTDNHERVLFRLRWGI